MNRIGLDQNSSKAIAKALNELLANYQVLYVNVRGFHWNIKGEKFFELHVKYEELYDDLIIKVDEIAERILTLGEQPVHAFSEYLKLSSIGETTNKTGAVETLESILNSFETIITKQRAILSLAGEADDEGTTALMSDYIREQEKLVWMYSALLE